MDRYIVKDGKRMKLGYTTGSCAAAAAKAAAYMLLTGRRRESVSLFTPKGVPLTLSLHDVEMAEDFVRCAVEKDGGDDPDVTTGAWIYARVSPSPVPGVHIDGGEGVGRVTKPGLDQPVGEAAINSVPRQMIRENVEEVCRTLDHAGGLTVIISVPGGGELAKKTFNPRLGIVGGISIIGTTGIVEPMSEQALTDTILVELRQRRELGEEYALLTPGNYGSDFIRDQLKLDPARAVMTSNFIGDALDHCKSLGYKGALLVGHAGKLVKLAGGMWNTHSKFGDCRMEILAAHAAACGLKQKDAQAILECATVDEALRILTEAGLKESVLARLTQRIGFLLAHRAEEDFRAEAILFSKVYGKLCETKGARELLTFIGG